MAAIAFPPPVKISADRLEDIPELISSHGAFEGKSGIGGDLAARTKLLIYPNSATVRTTIMKYSSAPSDLREICDPCFFKSIGVERGVSMVTSIQGPVQHRDDLTKEQYETLVKKTEDGSFIYPLVERVTWVNSLEGVSDTPEVKKLAADIRGILEKSFPNHTICEVIKPIPQKVQQEVQQKV